MDSKYRDWGVWHKSVDMMGSIFGGGGGGGGGVTLLSIIEL